VKHSILMVFALGLVACASQSSRQALRPLAADGLAFASAPAAVSNVTEAGGVEVEPLPDEAVENIQVCEQRKRPGSHIAETFCYTRDEQAARAQEREKALSDQLDELQREARWRDEIIRQAELEGRRPSGFGLGPN
jgi:hypothetical protein